MDKKTMMIVIVAAVVIIAAGCACFLLLKGKGGEPAEPEYEGVWAVETIHEAYYEDGVAKFVELPVDSASDMTITKEGDFFKLVRGDSTYYAVQKMKGLLSVDASGDTRIASAHADGDILTMGLMDLDTRHVATMTFKRVLLEGEAQASAEHKRSWNPAEGQTYDAYQKTRYVGEVPIDYDDVSYKLTVDKNAQPYSLIMFRQTLTYEDSELDTVIDCIAIPFGKDNWISIGNLNGETLMDYVMYQDGNLYFFSAYDYQGAFSIWDVRYGDEKKDIPNYYDSEGDINYGTEKVLYADTDGSVMHTTRDIVLYGDKSFDDHQLMDLYVDGHDVPDVYAVAGYKSGGVLTTYAQCDRWFFDKQYPSLIIGSYGGETIEVCGISYGDDGAILYIQEFVTVMEYPRVKDIDVNGDYYRYFDIVNAVDAGEWSPLGWGAMTYEHTLMVSDSMSWNANGLLVDHDKNTVQLRGNDKAYLYDVTLKFEKVEYIEALVDDGVLTIAFDGIQEGFSMGIEFTPVDRLVGEWELQETFTGTWHEGVPLIGVEYGTGTLTITDSGDFYTISDGNVEVLGTGDGTKIATAGLIEGAGTTYIISNVQSPFMRVVYIEEGYAAVKIYAPKGYVGPYQDVRMTCELPEIGETIPAYRIMKNLLEPESHPEYGNKLTLWNAEDGMIFYTVDTNDVGMIYSVGLYMNGEDFFALSQCESFQFVEMISFYGDVIYSQYMDVNSTWAIDYGDEASAAYPYEYFAGKVYEGKEYSAIYKDGALVEKNVAVDITLKTTYQLDDFLQAATWSENDEQATVWGMKIGTLSGLNHYSVMNVAVAVYGGVEYVGTYLGYFSDDLGEFSIVGNLVGEDGSTVVVGQIYSLKRRSRNPNAPPRNAGRGPKPISAPTEPLIYFIVVIPAQGFDAAGPLPACSMQGGAAAIGTGPDVIGEARSRPASNSNRGQTP
jgi:hypothetical protein